MRLIIMMGPPYSGKGTQCEILAKHTGYIHVSTGAKFREEQQLGTKIGKEFSKSEALGTFVSDEIMREFIAGILEANKDATGIILDGYPRTIPQVNEVASLGLDVELVLNLVVDTDTLLKRAKKRAKTSGRKDDANPDLYMKRINTFNNLTQIAIDHMRTMYEVQDIDSSGSVQEVSTTIKKFIRMHLKGQAKINYDVVNSLKDKLIEYKPDDEHQARIIISCYREMMDIMGKSTDYQIKVLEDVANYFVDGVVRSVLIYEATAIKVNWGY